LSEIVEIVGLLSQK